VETAATGAPAPTSRAYVPHRCRPPERGFRGQQYECWCGRRWVAASGVTVRGNRITSLRPDWRFVRPNGRTADTL
jgi:hypothetical protein